MIGLFRAKGSNSYWTKPVGAIKEAKRKGIKEVECYDGHHKDWQPYEPEDYEEEIANQEIAVENIKQRNKKKYV